MNIKTNLCTGCGTCSALCPKGAINIFINEKGTYSTEIDYRKCNNCKICDKVCPGYEIDFNNLNNDIFNKKSKTNKLVSQIGNYIECYTGYSKNPYLRYHSTSGGLVTQILISSLEKGIIDGVLVTGMDTNNPFEPRPFIARTKEEIIEASKSKYCPVPANVALREILESKVGDRFAVVGLPCHIQGIRKAEQVSQKLRDKIVLHLGIFCNHTPSFKATEFLLKKLKLRKEDVQRLQYRAGGWPGDLKIELKGGMEIMRSGYWGRGFGQYFMPTRCTLCCDHTNELADISFGDAWVPEIQKNDEIGTSVMILRNSKVKWIINEATNIHLEPLAPEKVIQSQKDIIDFKKSDIFARMNLLKLFGYKEPLYSLEKTKPSIIQYLKAGLLYLKLGFASTKLTWRTLYFYQSMLDKLPHRRRK